MNAPIITQTTTTSDPDKPRVFTLIGVDLAADHQDRRDSKRRDYEDRLDRLEADCDYRTRAPWP